MNRFRIVFEGFSAEETGQIRAEGFLPFKLRARLDVEHPSHSYTFGVRYADVNLEFDALRSELGEPLDRATIRWAVAQAEERLRSGRMPSEPTREIEKLVLTEADLALLRSMALEKTCEYQTRSGRDLFCSAASTNDRTVVGSAGLRRLAPTSRPMCKQCNMPDTDYVCAHLTHPKVVGAEAIGVSGRQLVGAYCEIGQEEVRSDPSRCRAGGHRCWTRIVEEPPARSASVPYTPRDLPVALDFLDAVWKQTFGHPLLRLRSVEKTAALSLPCATAEELKSRLGDLNELFKLMEVPDELLSEPIDRQQTFNRISACLETKVRDAAERENAANAMDDLRAINVVRNKLTHGGSELADALNRLDIEYPIHNHGQIWDQIRSKAAAALTTIRSALQVAS